MSPIERALVTGGRGFVGAWLCRALVERGVGVTSFDRRGPRERPSTLAMLGLEGRVAEREGELVDGPALAQVLREGEIDTVFHLAAETIVGAVQADPGSGFETNVRGTWTVLEACRAERVERVVVASSDKAYGAHDELPYTEDFALLPTAPYEASKAAADLIARSYWPAYGLPVAVTRFANVYGGGDLNFSRLVPEATSRRSRDARRFSDRTARRSGTSSTWRTRPSPTWRSPTASTATTSAARPSTPEASAPTRCSRSSRR